MKIRTLLILLVLSAAAGCGQPANTVGPTPTPSVNAPAPTVVVRVEGRVLDDDGEAAVAGAVVTGLDGWLNELPGLSTTAADDQGAFGFTANLAQGALGFLIVRGTRDGYEPSQIGVGGWNNGSGATAVVLRLQPRISIHAGESIQTGVLPDPQGWRGCGFEGWSCRRFFVEPPSGESMDVEVVPADDQLVTLMVGPPASHNPFEFPNQRRVTASGGEVWIYGEGGGRVTLTAHRR